MTTTSSLLDAVRATGALNSFWHRCAAEVEKRGGVRGRIRFASDDERSEVGLLVGRRLTSSVDGIRLVDLDLALQKVAESAGVLAVVEGVLGRTLRNLPEERHAARAAWVSVWDEARQHPAVARHPGLHAWLDQLARGTLRRIARNTDARELLLETLTVVAELPTVETELLSLLAERTLHNPHALDPDRAAGGLVIRALAHLEGRTVRGSGERRDLWYRYNAVCDRLSSTVLALNLRASGSATTLVDILELYAEAGEPAHLTLSMLHRWGRQARWDSRVVHVCENPSVMDAAARTLGTSCAPLVCISGQMSIAARRLLRHLLDDGVEVRFHGDFDWGGIEIANAVMALARSPHTIRPWRYTVADYREGVTRSPGDELQGRRVRPVWDPELGVQMAQEGTCVYEEGVAALLVDDLREAGSPNSAQRQGNVRWS